MLPWSTPSQRAAGHASAYPAHCKFCCYSTIQRTIATNSTTMNHLGGADTGVLQTTANCQRNHSSSETRDRANSWHVRYFVTKLVKIRCQQYWPQTVISTDTIESAPLRVSWLQHCTCCQFPCMGACLTIAMPKAVGHDESTKNGALLSPFQKTDNIWGQLLCATG